MISAFSEHGATIDYKPLITREEVLAYGQKIDGIIINSKIKADRELLDTHPSIQLIARLGSGLDIIDLPLCASRNIKVVSAPEGNRLAVAEHALGMILMLFNKLRSSQQVILESPWPREEHRGIELSGKTIGIIGFGHTGSSLVRILQGFEIKFLIFDPYKPHISQPDRSIYTSEWETLLRSSDIISLHVPLTDETKWMIGEEEIKQMKVGSILVNTSRGKVLDLQAAYRYLEKGHLAGLCLDVYANEDSRSWTKEEKELYQAVAEHKNSVTSPHVAGWTKESFYKISNVIVQKINAL